MAQEIVSWCDIHLDKGDHIAGKTWGFSFSEPDGKARTFELDCCAECGEQLSALFNSVTEHARQVNGPKTPAPKALRAAKAPKADPAPEPSPAPVPAPARPVATRGGAVACPICNVRPRSVTALTTHLREQHDTTPGELDGTSKAPCPVPGCSRRAKDQRGVMSHVRGAHPDYYKTHRKSLLKSA